MNELMNEINEWMTLINKRASERTNEWMDEWMNEQVNKQVNQQVNNYSVFVINIVVWTR